MYKLVRDNVPELVNSQDGPVADFAEIKNDEFYLKALNTKLVEECNEYLASGSVEELVDVMTVIKYLIKAKTTEEEFQKMYDSKLKVRGGFDKRYLMLFPDQGTEQSK